MHDKKVAILVANDIEHAELVGPRQALEEAGVTVDLITTGEATVQTMEHDKLSGHEYEATKTVDQANADDYDAIVLPGGTLNADELRTSKEALQFVTAFQDQHKSIAAICHAPWALISADLVEGKTLTSWPSLQDDIRNVGGTWVDQEVVVDDNFITSRNPDDIPAFNKEILAALA